MIICLWEGILQNYEDQNLCHYSPYNLLLLPTSERGCLIFFICLCFQAKKTKPMLTFTHFNFILFACVWGDVVVDLTTAKFNFTWGLFLEVTVTSNKWYDSQRFSKPPKNISGSFKNPRKFPLHFIPADFFLFFLLISVTSFSSFFLLFSLLSISYTHITVLVCPKMSSISQQLFIYQTQDLRLTIKCFNWYRFFVCPLWFSEIVFHSLNFSHVSSLIHPKLLVQNYFTCS